MARPRLSFLPAFFTTLAIVFVIAIWLRVRSYHDTGSTVTETSAALATTSGGTSPQPIAIVRAQNATEPSAIESAPSRQPRRTATPLAPLPPAKSSAMAPAKKQQALTAANTGAAKPSLFSRIVSPIVQAITGSKPSSGSPSSSAQQPAQISSGGGGRSATTGTSGGGTSTADPNDPNSDTQPPQLVSITFTPATIHDGEQTVMSVQATDNLSGVRSVSGTIAAPSGAVQGFACQRQGDADLYVANISVPKDAAEGVWKVNYLSLIDNASNAATLSTAQGTIPATATFRVVSSSSDTQGPTLKAIWLSSPAIRAGEKDTVFVDAEDDKSGVNLISGVFVSPAKHARIGFVCRPGDGTTWQGDLSTPSCIDCGDWMLEQVQLQDKANNMTTVRSDNPLVANVRVNITGDRCDSTAPEVTSLILDRNMVSNAQDSVINVTAIATDDMCGVMSISGQVTGPTPGARLYISFTAGNDPQSWVGRIVVPKLAAKGTWRVTWIQALDQAHNLKTYSQSDPALANAVFTVQ